MCPGNPTIPQGRDSGLELGTCVKSQDGNLSTNCVTKRKKSTEEVSQNHRMLVSEVSTTAITLPGLLVGPGPIAVCTDNA